MTNPINMPPVAGDVVTIRRVWQPGDTIPVGWTRVSDEPKAEPSVAALRMELAECRALLVDTIADPSPEDIKRAADWLANWDGKRIDVGAESERVELNREVSHELRTHRRCR